MAKATDGKKTTGGLLRRLNSLRVQVGSIVLISYLVPALLLGIFTGAILPFRGFLQRGACLCHDGAERQPVG